ncbi:MAG: translation elongation factor Ts [Bdellovibrionota bacterium]
MAVTAGMVSELRQKTGAGMLDCKKALEETGGDMEKAIVALRKKGLASAAKKSGRIATEGAIGSYIHAGGNIGVLVEVNSETDFVAKNEMFQAFIKDVCLHIAANKPSYIEPEEVPAEVLAKEKEIALDQAIKSGKPQAVAEKIVEGKMSKYFDEVCLLKQSFLKDPDKTVGTVLQEMVAKIGENIKVRRFVRWELGEGLEKKSNDFAAEVAAQAGMN